MKQTLLSLSLCFISLFGFAYSDVYPSAADFVNCLQTNKNRIPPNQIYSKWVTSFTSVLTVSGKDDLFWALRGGGGASFGVVLSYKLKLVTIEPKVTVFQVERYQNTKILYDYQECTQTCDRNLFIRVLLHPITVDATLNREILTTYIGMYVGNATSLVQEIGRNFASLGLDETDCEEMSWIDSVHFWANFDNTTDPSDGHVGYFKRKSDYVKEKITISDLEALLAKMVKMANPWLVFNSFPRNRLPNVHRGE